MKNHLWVQKTKSEANFHNYYYELKPFIIFFLGQFMKIRGNLNIFLNSKTTRYVSDKHFERVF